MKNLGNKLPTMLASVIKSVWSVLIYPFQICKTIGGHFKSPSVMLYALIFFLIDRITKMMILNHAHQLPVKVINKFFTITYVKNPGVAFGWFPDWRLPPILMALTMILIIGYYSVKLPDDEKLTRWALALLVGGAIGNLYDRIMYGFVIDFFLFHFGKFDFPVFNVADIAIDVGVFILFIDIFFLSPDEETDKKKELELSIQ